MSGLNLNRLITASINLSPSAAQYNNLNTALFLGASDVIDTAERLRTYTDLASVAADFGTSASEYLAAALYFGQSPSPTNLMIGRWAKTATKGLLKGGVLSGSAALLATWTAITNGSFKIAIDGGSLTAITGCDFHAETNFNGIASIITAKLTGATCTWTGERFLIESSSTGTSSSIDYLVAHSSGTDIHTLLGMASGTATKIDGIAAETAETAASLFVDTYGGQWYALMFADTALVDADHQAVAAVIEASPHIYGLTSTSASVIASGSTLESALSTYTRTFGQYSQNAYAVASLIGRFMVVNFEGNNTVISGMYKQEPTVTPETLTETQANTLKTKRWNVFVNYANDTAIVQYGTMFGSAYIDEIYGLDWLANRIQTDVYNLLYTSTTKIPQTDAGIHLITTTIEAALAQAVTNGLVAPGTWNSQGFGSLAQGDFLFKGYYVYVPSVSTQSSADRAARKTPPFQIAAKLAGAVDTVDISILVNR